MAGRNRNTFLKRQREIDRSRRAKEKMDKRHGKKVSETDPSGEGHVTEAADAGSNDGAAEAPPVL